MRTIETAVYTFDELSDTAKERARQWFREASGPEDFDQVIEDAQHMGEILGFSFRTHAVPLHGGGTRHDPCIWWKLGYSQSDGVWIEASYSYAKGAHTKIRAEAPQDTVLHDLADRLLGLQKAYGYQLTATVRHDDRGPMDLSVEHPTREFPQAVYTDFREIIRDYEKWIYRQLRQQDEWRNADEQVDETIRENEYEFTADGKRI